MTLANLGLTKILAVSVLVLNAIYPISIILIVLAMLDSFLKESSLVYKFTILFTDVVSVVDALGLVVTYVKSSLNNRYVLNTENLE